MMPLCACLMGHRSAPLEVVWGARSTSPDSSEHSLPPIVGAKLPWAQEPLRIIRISDSGAPAPQVLIH